MGYPVLANQNGGAHEDGPISRLQFFFRCSAAQQHSDVAQL